MQKQSISNDFTRGPLLVLLAAVLWGTTGTSQALAPVGSSPQEIGALRLLIGGAALLVYAGVRDPASFRDVRLKMAAAAGVFVATYQLCFFWGVSRTGVAVGTMVAIGSAPVFAGMLEFLFRSVAPGRIWLRATALAISGCICLGLSGSIEIDVFGIILAAGAGLSYAGYTLLMKNLLRDTKPETVAALVFCCGAVFLLPLLLSSSLSWVLSPVGMIVVIHLGLLATSLSYYLFCRGLERVQASTAVTLSLAEPLTATLLGIFLVGERLTIFGVAGLALLLGGLVIIAWPSTSRRMPGGNI